MGVADGPQVPPPFCHCTTVSLRPRSLGGPLSRRVNAHVLSSSQLSPGPAARESTPNPAIHPQAPSSNRCQLRRAHTVCLYRSVACAASIHPPDERPPPIPNFLHEHEKFSRGASMKIQSFIRAWACTRFYVDSNRLPPHHVFKP